MSIQALGNNYFNFNKCSINLARVYQEHHLSHAHDLTETEHYHDFIEIVIIMHGHGVQVLEGNEYSVSAGDVFVLQGNQKHYFKDASQVEIVNVMYDGIKNPEMIPDRIRQLEGYNALFILEPQYRAHYHFKNMLRLNREELSKIEIMLNVMFHEQQQKQEGFEMVLNNRLQELIILLSRHYSNIQSTEAQSLVRISKVLDFIESNLSSKVYIDDLAQMAFMSKRNFMRVFKRAVGLSPVQHLTQVRLQNARKLLRETNRQIADISLACGFSDSNYFIKCFKKSYGTTPFRFKSRFKK